MKITIVALLITSVTIGNNQLETFSGYMVNEFNALTVGHKANKILKFQENYNAWIRFEVYNVQSYMPVDHNGVIFRDIPVIDVQVLTANVQKGMPGDIAVLTFFDTNKDYIIPKSLWVQSDYHTLGNGEITVFLERAENEFLTITQNYYMYEKADCQQLFHVHVTINQVCGFSTSQQVFLEVYEGAGLLMGNTLMAIAVYKRNGVYQGNQISVVVLEKPGIYNASITAMIDYGDLKAQGIQNGFNQE